MRRVRVMRAWRIRVVRSHSRTQFTSFTGTKVQILIRLRARMLALALPAAGAVRGGKDGKGRPISAPVP